MGRPSKLTPAQCLDIQTRLSRGESVSALAREFGVGRSTISERFSASVQKITTVANKVVKAEAELEALPLSERMAARSLIDDLRTIGTNLTAAASYGAQTAHQLARMAHGQVNKVVKATEDGQDPMESAEILQGVSALGKLANEAGKLGVDLIAANRDRLAAADAAQTAPEDEEDLSLLSTAELLQLQALTDKARGVRVLKG